MLECCGAMSSKKRSGLNIWSGVTNPGSTVTHAWSMANAGRMAVAFSAVATISPMHTSKSDSNSIETTARGSISISRAKANNFTFRLRIKLLKIRNTNLRRWGFSHRIKCTTLLDGISPTPIFRVVHMLSNVIRLLKLNISEFGHSMVSTSPKGSGIRTRIRSHGTTGSN